MGLQHLASEDRAVSQSLKALRVSLDISRTRFAQKIGIAPDLLAAKEAGRVRFRQEEIARFKAVVAAHIARSVKAHRHTFGEDAFPTLHSSAAPSMKLATITDKERAEIIAANHHLSNVCQLLQTEGAGLSKLESELADAIEELASAKRGRGDIRKLAETINVVETQIKLLQERQEKAAREFERWRRMGAKAIAETGELISRVAQAALNRSVPRGGRQGVGTVLRRPGRTVCEKPLRHRHGRLRRTDSLFAAGHRIQRGPLRR